MAKLMFAVVAERVSVDQFTNILDVHNVIEVLQVPEPPPEVLKNAREAKKPPGFRFNFALLSHWRRTNPSKPEQTVRQRVQLLSPAGSVLASAELEFNMTHGPYTRNVIRFNAIPIAGPGTYVFRIAVKSGRQWRRVGETSYELLYDKAAEGKKIRLQ